MSFSLLPALASWTVVGIITGLILGVGFSVMSMSPPAFVMAKVCFTAAAVIFFAKVGFWLASSKSSTSERLLLTVLICAIGGVCWVELIRWVDGRRPLEEKTAPSKSDKKPPTLSDLFKSDFPNVMKMTDEDRVGIEWKDRSVLKIKTQVYLDFPAKVQFVGFYIPTSSHTFDACLALVNSVRSTIEDLPKRVAVSAGYRNEQNKIEDLIFSGRVLLYHEDFLSIPQQAAAIATYSARGFDVNFRGPDYLGDQVIAWHRQRAAKAAH